MGIEHLTTPDGRTLAWTARGAGPVLVAHGGGPGADPAYLDELPDLGKWRTVVALHARGTGASSRASTYALAEYAADLETLREHLGVERLDVLGHSHGGFVAMTWAAAHPGRVGRLVLANTHARFDWTRRDGPALVALHAGEPWFAAATAAHERRTTQTAELSDDDIAALYEQAVPLLFARAGPRELALAKLIGKTFNGDALRWFNANLAPTFDLRPLLASITAPTLVISGERDPAAPPSAAAELAGLIPGARLALVPDAGHFTAWESMGREAFAREVGEFLVAG